MTEKQLNTLKKCLQKSLEIMNCKTYQYCKFDVLTIVFNIIKMLHNLEICESTTILKHPVILEALCNENLNVRVMTLQFIIEHINQISTTVTEIPKLLNAFIKAMTMDTIGAKSGIMQSIFKDLIFVIEQGKIDSVLLHNIIACASIGLFYIKFTECWEIAGNIIFACVKSNRNSPENSDSIDYQIWDTIYPLLKSILCKSLSNQSNSPKRFILSDIIPIDEPVTSIPSETWNGTIENNILSTLCDQEHMSIPRMFILNWRPEDLLCKYTNQLSNHTEHSTISNSILTFVFPRIFSLFNMSEHAEKLSILSQLSKVILSFASIEIDSTDLPENNITINVSDKLAKLILVTTTIALPDDVPEDTMNKKMLTKVFELLLSHHNSKLQESSVRGLQWLSVFPYKDYANLLLPLCKNQKEIMNYLNKTDLIDKPISIRSSLVSNALFLVLPKVSTTSKENVQLCRKIMSLFDSLNEESISNCISKLIDTLVTNCAMSYESDTGFVSFPAIYNTAKYIRITKKVMSILLLLNNMIHSVGLKFKIWSQKVFALAVRAYLFTKSNYTSLQQSSIVRNYSSLLVILLIVQYGSFIFESKYIESKFFKDEVYEMFHNIIKNTEIPRISSTNNKGSIALPVSLRLISSLLSLPHYLNGYISYFSPLIITCIQDSLRIDTKVNSLLTFPHPEVISSVSHIVIQLIDCDLENSLVILSSQSIHVIFSSFFELINKCTEKNAELKHFHISVNLWKDLLNTCVSITSKLSETTIPQSDAMKEISIGNLLLIIFKFMRSPQCVHEPQLISYASENIIILCNEMHKRSQIPSITHFNEICLLLNTIAHPFARRALVKCFLILAPFFTTLLLGSDDPLNEFDIAGKLLDDLNHTDVLSKTNDSLETDVLEVVENTAGSYKKEITQTALHQLIDFFTVQSGNTKRIKNRCLFLNTPSIYTIKLICGNLIYFTRSEDRSIRNIAADALYSLICYGGHLTTLIPSEEVANHEFMKHIVYPLILPSLRQGIVSQDILVRNEYLRCFGALGKSFPNIFPAFTSLYSPNYEQDFFSLISSPQHKLHLNALALLRNNAKSILPEEHLRVFIPYLLTSVKDFAQGRLHIYSTISEAKTKGYNQAVLLTISTICEVLPWDAFKHIICTVLEYAEKEVSLRYQMLQVIVLMIEKLNVKLLAIDIHTYSVENSAIIEFVQTYLLKKLFLFLSNKQTRDQPNANHTNDKKKFHINKIILQLPIAVAIARLLLFIPIKEAKEYANDLIYELINHLKTKEEKKRIQARKVLCDIMSILGPSYLASVIEKLKSQLVHGYQLHVLGYTLVILLESMQSILKPVLRSNSTERKYSSVQYLDDSFETLFCIFLDSYVGETGNQKEQTEFASVMPEVKHNRSMDGFLFLARNCNASMVYQSIVANLLWMLAPPSTRETLSKRTSTSSVYIQGYNMKYFAGDKLASPDFAFVQKVQLLGTRVAKVLLTNLTLDLASTITDTLSYLTRNLDTRNNIIENFEAKDGFRRIRGNITSHLKASKKSTRELFERNFSIEQRPERIDVDIGTSTVLATQQKRLRKYLGRNAKFAQYAPKQFPDTENYSQVMLDTVDNFCIKLLTSLLKAILSLDKKSKLKYNGILSNLDLEILENTNETVNLDENSESSDTTVISIISNSTDSNSFKQLKDNFFKNEKVTDIFENLKVTTEIENNLINEKKHHFVTKFENLLCKSLTITLSVLDLETSDFVVSNSIDCLECLILLKSVLPILKSAASRIWNSIQKLLLYGGTVKHRTYRLAASMISQKMTATDPAIVSSILGKYQKRCVRSKCFFSIFFTIIALLL